MNVSVLPAHERVILQITHVIEWGLGIEFKKQPADVGMEKAFANVVGILVVVGYLLVMRVFFKESKELDKKIDYSKMKEWKDED